MPRVAYLKSQGRRSHVDAGQIFKRHITGAWPSVAEAPAKAGLAYWKLIAARAGVQAGALRLHLLTGGQRIEQFVRLKWADVSDDALTIFDGKGRLGYGPRADQIPLLARADLSLLKREGEFAISTTANKKAISVRTLAR